MTRRRTARRPRRRCSRRASGREPTLRRSAAGTIYDLGYRRYDGPRLGRRGTRSGRCSSTSLRAVFGLGRGDRAKIVPWVLAVARPPAARSSAARRSRALAPAASSSIA